MSVGPAWSKGSEDQYKALEKLFNDAKEHDDGAEALSKFAKALRHRKGKANVICEQIRLLAAIRGTGAEAAIAAVAAQAAAELAAAKAAEAEAEDADAAETAKEEAAEAAKAKAPELTRHYDVFKSAADNWFGDDKQPMWSGRTKTRPAEMHRIICAAEAYLADLLVAGARRCQFFGQCKHHEFEMWITWPPYGFDDEEVRVWLFSPNDYLYTEDEYAYAVPALSSPKRNQVGLADQVENDVGGGSTDVKIAYKALRTRFDDPTLGPAERRQLDETLQTAQTILINTAAGHPDPEFTAFKGTPLAIAYDGGVPLIGDVRVQYLEDFLAEPREPRLNQPPAEMFAPAGAPAAGVRFRWDRSLPGPWPAYRPLRRCLTEMKNKDVAKQPHLGQ